MRRRPLPEVYSPNPNVTPLIDVVMCLIIFFMLVAKIGVNTGAEVMNIPSTLIGVDLKDLGNTLTLNVRPGPPVPSAESQPYVTALVGGHAKELKIRDKNNNPELADLLRYFRYGPSRMPNSPADNPNFSVIIRAEEDLPYRFLEPVLRAASEANVKNVSFNTRKLTVRAATGGAGAGAGGGAGGGPGGGR